MAFVTNFMLSVADDIGHDCGTNITKSEVEASIAAQNWWTIELGAATTAVTAGAAINDTVTD